MCYSKIFHKYREKMKTEMIQAIDKFWDEVNPEKEDQVPVGIKKLEDRFNKAFVDTAVVLYNYNQESAPLLPEQQQELRNRLRSEVLPGEEPVPEQDSEPEESHNESPGAQKPEESFGKRVLRLFREMLSRQKKKWKDVLASVFASLVQVAKTIWSVIESFFSSVAKYFSSLCQA